MVNKCCIKDCRRRGSGSSLFIVPKNSNEKTKCAVTLNLLRKRREAWLQALGIIDDQPNRAYHVCSNHFVSGKPANVMKHNDIDWVPTLRLSSSISNSYTEVDILENIVVESDPSINLTDQVSNNNNNTRSAVLEELSLVPLPQNSTIFKIKMGGRRCCLCHRSYDQFGPVKLFKLPTINDKTSRGDRSLTITRIEAWLRVINAHSNRPSLPNPVCVCSRHFQKRKPAYLWDRNNIDWVPNMNLSAREDAADSTVAAHFFCEDDMIQQEESPVEVKLEVADDPISSEQPPEEDSPAEIKEEAAEEQVYQSSCFRAEHFFDGDDAKVEFYTSVTGLEKLWFLFRFIEDRIASNNEINRSMNDSALPLFEQFCLTIITLRMNADPQDLGYRFNLSRSDVAAYVDHWITILFQLLPQSEIIWPTDPHEIFAKNSELAGLVAVVDLVQLPTFGGPQSAQYLLAFNPTNGSVIFVSNAFPFNKHRAEFVWSSCGILNNFGERDKLVLTNSGATLYKTMDLGLVGQPQSDAQCKTLFVLVNDRIQLHLVKSKELPGGLSKLASALNASEALKNRFAVLKNPALRTMSSVTIQSGAHWSGMAKVVHVCCALHNILMHST